MAKTLGGALVALVVCQPHGDFGDLGGVFVNFDAMKLADVALLHGGNVEQLAFGKQFANDVVFEPAQFAVGHHQKVAAAAGGIEKAQAAHGFVQSVDGFSAFGFGCFFGCFKLLAQVIHKQAVDDLEDVGFFGVVRAQFAPLDTVHDALKQAAKNFGADFGPVAVGAFKQQFAQLGVEIKLAQAVGKQIAIDVGKRPDFFRHAVGATLKRCIQYRKNAIERTAHIRAVCAGEFLQVIGKLVVGKDQGVVGKKAKQQADDELLEVVLGVVAVFFKGGVQVAHGCGGFDIGLLFGGFQLAADAVHKVEIFALDVLGQFAQGKGQRFKRVLLRALVQVVKMDVGKVADDDIARHVGTVVAAYFFDIPHGLGKGFGQILAGAFVLAQQLARPEHIGKLGAAFAVLDLVFHGGGAVAVEIEDGEKFVPEGIFLGALAGLVFPAFGELLGQAVFVFVGVGGHVQGCKWLRICA